MADLVDSIRSGPPAPLVEVARLGRTLWKRAVLGYLFRTGISNGSTEAI